MRFSFFRNPTVPGALILPRRQVGQVNWPRCAICQRIVDAYGKENETEAHVEIWAKCSGVLIDPQSGRVVGNAAKMHPERKGSVVIEKGEGWTDQRFTDIVSRLSFFGPDTERRYEQNTTAEGIEAKG